MLIWKNTRCFDFFSCNLIGILSQYVQNYRPLPQPHLLINLFKVATYLSCGEDY